MLSRKLGTTYLEFIYCLRALLFCQVDFFFFIVPMPAVISRLMLHKPAGLGPETGMEPHALCRFGGVVCECRTNADRVPAGARSANRQRGGRSGVRFYGVVMVTARAAGRALLRGGCGQRGGPALSPGLRRQVGHRRGNGTRGAGWQRGRMRAGSGGPRAAPGRGQPGTGGGAGPSGCRSGVL